MINLKDKMIPAMEKLPKSSIFYCHYLAQAKNKRIEKAAKEKADEDRQKFDGASEYIS